MNESGSRWTGEWIPDESTTRNWSALVPDTEVEVIKRRSDGAEAARYRATVAVSDVPAPWIEIHARWTMPNVEIAGLVFATGDTLREFFSPRHPFNGFAVVDSHGTHRGWYGNVTYPAFLVPQTALPTLVWHDLVLDAIVLPGKEPILVDDDELQDAVILGESAGLRGALGPAREAMIAFIHDLDRQRVGD